MTEDEQTVKSQLTESGSHFTASYSRRNERANSSEMRQPLLSSSSGNFDDKKSFEMRDAASSGDEYVTIEIPPVPSYGVPDNATTTALYICKEKVLKPYMQFLKVSGWRPLITIIYPSVWKRVVNFMYPVLVLFIIVLGYIVQFAACYSRSNPGYEYRRGVNGKYIVSCYDHSISSYAIPDALHIAVYSYCFYLFRWVKTEQLQILMEKTFLQTKSAKQRGYLSQGKLTASLRWFLWIGIIWISFSLVTQTLGVASRAIESNRTTFGSIDFTWMKLGHNTGAQYALAIVMLLAFMVLDVVYVGAVVNYITQCNLLIFLIRGIAERVREKTLSLQHAIKEYTSVGELIKQLNIELGIAVSILEFLVGWLTLSAWLSFSKNVVNSSGLLAASMVMNVLQWTPMALLPFIYAARLSNACETIRKIGLEIRARPFGYQDAAQDDLDSFLLFTSSFSPRAKLFRVPISAPYLWGALVLFCFIILLLGQQGFLPSGVF